MSKFSEFVNQEVTRRDFILKASAAGFCLLNCEISAQQTENPPLVKALDDENIIHTKVNFKNIGF